MADLESEHRRWLYNHEAHMREKIMPRLAKLRVTIEVIERPEDGKVLPVETIARDTNRAHIRGFLAPGCDRISFDIQSNCLCVGIGHAAMGGGPSSI